MSQTISTNKIPRASVTRPIRPLTQETAELMSNRRPVISGPYGLDADIDQVIFLPKVCVYPCICTYLLSSFLLTIYKLLLILSFSFVIYFSAF